MKSACWVLTGLLVCLMSCSDDSTVPNPDSHKTKDFQTAADSAKTDAKAADSQVKDVGAPSCADLAAAYVKAVEEARACGLTISKLQCIEKVDTTLDCPCPTYVNPDNTEARQTIKDLAAQWTTRNCKTSGCPPVPCKTIAQGLCKARGAGADGVCTDMGQD
jgi:hypothetical protein